MAIAFMRIVRSMFMNYELFWREERKGLLNMCKSFKIKLIKEYKTKEIKKLLESGYYEIPCEPTSCEQSILLSNKRALSFDEVIDIIVSLKGKKYMLLASSSLYYNYLEKFYEFYEESDKKLRKRLYRRTNKCFKRWYAMSLRSDTELYPQNLLIIEFVKKHMSEIIDLHGNVEGL